MADTPVFQGRHLIEQIAFEQSQLLKSLARSGHFVGFQLVPRLRGIKDRRPYLFPGDMPPENHTSLVGEPINVDPLGQVRPSFPTRAVMDLHSLALNVASDLPGRQRHGEKLVKLIGRNGIQLVPSIISMLPVLESRVIPFPEIARLCTAREHFFRRQPGYESRIGDIRPRPKSDAGLCQCPMAYPRP